MFRVRKEWKNKCIIAATMVMAMATVAASTSTTITTSKNSNNKITSMKWRRHKYSDITGNRCTKDVRSKGNGSNGSQLLFPSRIANTHRQRHTHTHTYTCKQHRRNERKLVSSLLNFLSWYILIFKPKNNGLILILLPQLLLLLLLLLWW